MKNKSLITVIIALAAVIASAAFLYPRLAEKYSPKPQPENPVEKTESVPAADFTVYDMDGNEVKLSDSFGKPIIVNFWATWCGPCRSELPAFENAYNEYRDDITFLMVDLTDGRRDTKEVVAEFVEEGGFSFPVYLDEKGYAAEAYGIYAVPETLFINSDGLISDTRLGAMSEQDLYYSIEKLLEE